MKSEKVLIIADGAAFGPQMNDIYAYDPDTEEENQTCLIGRKPSQMSKLDLLQSVMIFPFDIMNLKGRERKYVAFDQIAL